MADKAQMAVTSPPTTDAWVLDPRQTHLKGLPAKSANQPFGPLADSDPTAWRVTLETDSRSFWTRWDELSQGGAAATAFQTTAWLRAWYATLGAQKHVDPLLVRVHCPADGLDRLLLPLIRIRQAGLRTLIPADLDVTDYNGPLLMPGLNLDAQQSKSLWALLKRELAQHGDLLRLQKMLPNVQGQTNPLALALKCRTSPSVGHVFHVPQCWDAWHNSLKRQARRESSRHLRLFKSYADARFERITDLQTALQTFEALEAMQLARLGERGRYLLNLPAYSEFYRHRMLSGLEDGSVVLTALRAEGQTVAVAYGIRHAQTFTLLRVAFLGERFKPCAPGRLLMELSARALWEDGCKTFDLSIGSYAHKHTFGCEKAPLLEACTPLTWRGMPAALAWHSKQAWARRQSAEPPPA